MKRSTDNGHHWSNLSVVLSESTAAEHVVIGNPAPVLDLASGRIFMIFSRNNAEVGVLHTDNEGLSWSAVTDLTATLMKPNGWTDIFTGLSAGLTLDPQGHGNRLIVCSNHNGPDKNTSTKNHGRYSSSIYSDDAGATWKAGKNVGESTVAFYIFNFQLVYFERRAGGGHLEWPVTRPCAGSSICRWLQAFL